MKVLTAAQMREADRRAIEAGIPGLILMENAAMRVVEVIAERYAPLDRHHIVVCCGKGNNGGDGLAIARQLFTRFRARVEVVLACEPEEFRGDALTNWRMLEATGCPVEDTLDPQATIVVDAVLGTGVEGPPRGLALGMMLLFAARERPTKLVAVDIPTGLGFMGTADVTVTFEAPKVEHYFKGGPEDIGELVVKRIGIPRKFIDEEPSHWLNVTEPRQARAVLGTRSRDTHKGSYGHVLVVGGAAGKSGAAAMAGLAALRAGAGLVTVACEDPRAMAPELMTAALETPPLEGKQVVAAGPGLGTDARALALLRAMLAAGTVRVLDADALTVAAAEGLSLGGCILTPHPGEMSRLTGLTTAQVQADRLGVARGFARERACTVVLKGHRTLIAFPDGEVWINPTGNPGMATGGSGDVLTGLIAGLAAQEPERWREAVVAAVWLHGCAGDHAAAELGERCVIATDLLRFLPRAMADAHL